MLVRRRALVSTIFGVGASVLIAFTGALWGGLVVVLSFALVFRSAERVSLRWLLLGFTVAWCIVIAAGIGVIRNMPPDSALVWAIAGSVPLVLSATTVVVARARTRGPQMPNPEPQGPT
jgi:hypothetical protein